MRGVNKALYYLISQKSSYMYITHNNKRYEVVNDPPFLGCLMQTEFGDIVEPKSLGHLEILVDAGAKMLIEIPLYNEHTLSSIMVSVDQLLQDKKNRRDFNRTRFPEFKGFLIKNV